MNYAGTATSPQPTLPATAHPRAGSGVISYVPKALLGFLIPALFMVRPALAATAVTPDTQVGETVTNPETNQDVVVTQIVRDVHGDVAYVVTADNTAILAKTTVGSILYTQTGSDPIQAYEVISVVKDPTSGLVVSVNTRLTTAASNAPTTAQPAVIAGTSQGPVSPAPPLFVPEPYVTISRRAIRIFSMAYIGSGQAGTAHMRVRA